MTDGMWDPAVDAAIEAHRKVMKAEEELDKLNREKQEAISRLNEEQLVAFVRATTR